jgi:hypothetical protein
MDRAAGATDVLVALVGIVGALACASRSTLAAVGLLGPAIAAILGALRFNGVESVIPQHLVAVHAAATIGMPLIGLSFVLAVARPTRSRTIAAAVFAVLVALSVALPGPGYRTIAGGAGMIASAVAAALLARRDRLAGAVGVSAAVLVIVDGLVIGGPGDLFGMSRTAWFHVVFAVAIGSLVFALLRASRSST